MVESYWRSHMDLLEPDPPLNLDEPAWPILTAGAQRLPASISGSARIENSLISPGCQIRGHVEHSVLCPGVVVEEGAVVRNSILFHDTAVSTAATIDYAIVDREVRVGAEARIGQDDASELKIALVGQRTHIPAGARVPAGGRVKPGTPEEEFSEHVHAA